MNGAVLNKAASDCSGFVWRTLKDRFNLPMERITTRELLHMGVAGQ
ncbi:lipoprotein nlpC [Klebsiella pneumoniae]|uniref:Lipoprotein nlpC n=1 Tax=Klebsiella pneumoniae TaxID=573 RepID=A0A4P0XPV5_KLEPN|nr:lipoprotein nlpC [Klebsiella pneumoniae]